LIKDKIHGYILFEEKEAFSKLEKASLESYLVA
jgi:hypothetical protein